MGPRGPFYEQSLTLIPAWISNYIHYKVWVKITYLFPNFNRCAVEVLEWTSNFILHFIMDVITYPCLDLSSAMLVKRPLLACHIHSVLFCSRSRVGCSVCYRHPRTYPLRRLADNSSPTPWPADLHHPNLQPSLLSKSLPLWPNQSSQVSLIWTARMMMMTRKRTRVAPAFSRWPANLPSMPRLLWLNPPLPPRPLCQLSHLYQTLLLSQHYEAHGWARESRQHYCPCYQAAHALLRLCLLLPAWVRARQWQAAVSHMRPCHTRPCRWGPQWKLWTVMNNLISNMAWRCRIW